ncbi:MAG: DUF2975 domain-containing protein [Bacteroidota bacterium]
MKTNTVIKLAIGLSRCIMGVCIFAVVLSLTVTVHWHFSKGYYDHIEVSQTFKAGFGMGDVQVLLPHHVRHEGMIMLSDLNNYLFYWLLVRAMVFVALVFLIVRSILQVLHSMKSVRTFHEGNIKHFRRISLFSFIATLFSVFNFGLIRGELMIYLDLPFGPLLFALGAYVMAEVFKEGKLLLEDQQLMI